MRQWVEVRGQLSGVAIEIDQLTLARESAAVGEALKSFLRLESREAEALAQALETDRPERTAQRFAATYSADELGWSAAERQIFERVCGPAMAEYGYAMGPEYFRAGEQRQGLVRL
jgi:Arc/MetJ family transcription regulator